MIFTGGEKLQAYLEDLSKKVLQPGTLEVGFFEGREYASGESVPYVAACNEFGGTRTVAAHDITIHRNPKARINPGRFIKQNSSKNAVSETYHVEAYTITVPPRPFFRRMISLGKEHWGEDLAAILEANGYDTKISLELLGEQMQVELVDSITAQVYAPLAASTVRAKGNDQQLIDSGLMRNSVNSQVHV